MGRSVKDHFIGEPVALSNKGMRQEIIESFHPRDFERRGIRMLKKRMTVVLFLTLLILMIFTFPFLFMMGLVPIIFMGVLIIFSFMVAIPISYFKFKRSMQELGVPGVFVKTDDLEINTYYSPSFPRVFLSIPWKNVGSIEFRGREIWDRNLKITPLSNRMFFRTPILPNEGLYHFWSSPEDLVTINLKKPVTVQKMTPPVGWRGVSRTQNLAIDNVIVDIDKRNHHRFKRLAQERRDWIE